MVKKIHDILLLNGPNLNLLGSREPSVYGAMTLAQIEEACMAEAQSLDLALRCWQSNEEGRLLEYIHGAMSESDAIIINPGAYGHSSIALADGLSAFAKPVLEVHISNIYRRESFRHHSYISGVALGVISGLGWRGYIFALRALASYEGDGDEG